jgi:hypothetical protein
MQELDVPALVDYGTLITLLSVLLFCVLRGGSIGRWWLVYRRVEVTRVDHPFAYWLVIATIGGFLLLVVIQAVQRLVLG